MCGRNGCYGLNPFKKIIGHHQAQRLGTSTGLTVRQLFQRLPERQRQPLWVTRSVTPAPSVDADKCSVLGLFVLLENVYRTKKTVFNLFCHGAMTHGTERPAFENDRSDVKMNYDCLLQQENYGKRKTSKKSRVAKIFD